MGSDHRPGDSHNFGQTWWEICTNSLSRGFTTEAAVPRHLLVTWMASWRRRRILDSTSLEPNAIIHGLRPLPVNLAINAGDRVQLFASFENTCGWVYIWFTHLLIRWTCVGVANDGAFAGVWWALFTTNIATCPSQQNWSNPLTKSVLLIRLFLFFSFICSCRCFGDLKENVVLFDG